MALVIILSVFNGLEEMVKSIFGTFDPDLEISIKEGKVFIPGESVIDQIASMEGVADYSLILEENALLKYGDKQYIATVKGVEDSYSRITGLDSVIWDGNFILKDEKGRDYAVVGQGVANNLGIGISFLTPLQIFVPKRTGSGSSINVSNAFIRRYIFPSGIFNIEQEFDSRYIFVPINLMRDLLEYSDEVSAIELKLDNYGDVDRVQPKIEALFGESYIVKNKYQQQEIFYKVMKSERLAIFVILSFIILIASFNIIGSLTMLIIEKEKDISILRSLGANRPLIRKIFIFEGWLISVIGTFSGIALGVLICWLQQQFGLVRLQGDTLIIDAYPVVLKTTDLALTAVTVLTIGFWAAWYPVRYLSKKYLKEN
jgi:lipoprotein-releasing system permease protein